MADFNFLQNPITKKWIISAPRRAKRPDIAKGAEPVCPFCIGREKDEQEVYRVGGVEGEDNWLVRVVPNKFPFAPIHEVIIHSPDHHKNFDELPVHQVELIIKTYRQRYMTHYDKGQVYIFHNRGEGGGESLPHPHTQLAVVPVEVKMDIPRLDPTASFGFGPRPLSLASQVFDPEDSDRRGETLQEERVEQIKVDTPHFYLFCPESSQWPDEVWIAPKLRGRAFGEITDGEVSDLAYTINRVIRILDLRHGHEFPFNFYIYPGGDWYLRIIPRLKSMGGFELGTGIFINTQDPKETIQFIKTHFERPDEERIRLEHQAEYGKSV